MDKKYIFLILLLAVISAISFIAYQTKAIKRTYKAEALKGLNRTGTLENSILEENDIKHLPVPVQKYLAYVGVIGKVKVKNARIVCEGEMKMDPQKDWIRIKTEQYNFYDTPTRLFHIEGIMKGIPTVGLDSYIHGKGNMLIKVASLFTVADSKGQEMDQGAAVTLFNDMCFFTPATLIDQRIHWETIDSLTVKATFDDSRCKVSAVLHFNEKGELINFITDDRYYIPLDGSTKRVRWSTPIKDYKEINGIKRPTYGEAIWHFEEGDYCYAKFTNIKEVEYNCKSFK